MSLTDDTTFVRDPEDSWWSPGGDPDEEVDRSDDIVATWKTLSTRDTMRRLRAVLHRDIYENCVTSLDHGAAVDELRSGRIPTGQLSFYRSIIDSLKSYIGNNMSTVRVASTDADWSKRLKAQRLDRYVQARFRDLRVPRTSAEAALEAFVTGTGCVKGHPSDGSVVVEIVPQEELVVDESQARYGEDGVRELYQRRPVARDVLVSAFPDHEEEILSAPGAELDPLVDRWTETDDRSRLVELVEAWHLPSADGAGDGVHVIAIPGLELLRETYDCPRFPVALYRFRRVQRSFWGASLLGDLVPLQAEVDRTLDDIRYALRVGTKTKVFQQRGSKVNRRKFSNGDDGAVVEYDGQKPIIEAPNPVSEQLFRHLDWLIQQMYSLAGISELTSNARLPSQVGSGRAIENLHDVQTKRFKDLDGRFMELQVDVANLVIDASKRLADDPEADLQVRWTGRHGRTIDIDWEQVELGPREFSVYLETQSLFPETRAGRISAIEQMIAAGQVPQALIASYLQNPDIDRLNRRLTASYNYVEWLIENLEDPDVEEPLVDDHCDLRLTLDLVKAAYLDDLTMQDPKRPDPDLATVLDRFRSFLASLVDEVRKLQEPPAITGQAPAVEAGPPNPATLQAV